METSVVPNVTSNATCQMKLIYRYTRKDSQPFLKTSPVDKFNDNLKRRRCKRHVPRNPIPI